MISALLDIFLCLLYASLIVALLVLNSSFLLVFLVNQQQLDLESMIKELHALLVNEHEIRTAKFHSML